MPYFGCHLSPSAGYLAMGNTAHSIGADAFQFFTRNPRGGKAKPLDESDVSALDAFLKEHHFGPVVAHAPYTINACAAVEKTREFALQTMADDLSRMAHLPGNYYNFHPGSHVGQGVEAGIAAIADTLNTVLRPEHKTMVLLETMSGKGTEVGGQFEELREIMDRVNESNLVGVCMDTCHVYDAGYDIVNDLDGVLTEFDRIIGLNKLCAIHVNDSKNPFSSHKDRHEKLGQGSLGIEAFRRIVGHPALSDLPMILETPNELPGYAEEIRILRSISVS